MKRMIITALTVLWMILIFWFSSKPADESTDMSMNVGKAVACILVPGFDEWPEEQQAQVASKIDHPIRKLAHATEYAVLSMLLTGMWGSYGLQGRRQFMTSWVSTAIYASTDEIHQLFVPGRSGQVTDVLIDSAGALIGILMVWMIARLFQTKLKG